MTQPILQTAASSSPSSSSYEALGSARVQSKSGLCQLPPLLFKNRIFCYLPTEDLAHLRTTCRMIAGADRLENGSGNMLSGMVEGEFASRITFNGPRGPLFIPGSLDAEGACVSLEALIEMVGSMVSDVSKKVQRLPSDLVNKLISAVKQQMATEKFSAIGDRVLREFKTTGKCDGFIQSLLGLTSEEQAQCQEMVEDLFKKFELFLKADMFLEVFGSVEAERFLESQAKQLEEFKRMGLSSEDLNSFFAYRIMVEDKALFLTSLTSLSGKVSQELYRMIPWIKSYMGGELFVQLFTEASAKFKGPSLDLDAAPVDPSELLLLTSRERSCARALSLNVSDHDIPSFLGSLLLSGLYTRQQIQEVVSLSLTINSNWTKDKQLLLRVTELAQHPDKAEILLSNNEAVNAETITTILRIKTLTPEIVSKLFNGLAIKQPDLSTAGLLRAAAAQRVLINVSVVNGRLRVPPGLTPDLILFYPLLSIEERNGFIQQILEENEASIPTSQLKAAFSEYEDSTGRRIIGNNLFSRLADEEPNAIVELVLHASEVADRNDIDLALRKIGKLNVELVSSLLKKLIHSFPKLKHEDRVGLIKQLLRQHAETIPTALLREIFWKPRDPSVRELVKEMLSSRETSIRSHGRELLHTACAISHASREGLREINSLLDSNLDSIFNSIIGTLGRIPIVGRLPTGFRDFTAGGLTLSAVAIPTGLFLASAMNAGNQDL